MKKFASLTIRYLHLTRNGLINYFKNFPCIFFPYIQDSSAQETLKTLFVSEKLFEGNSRVKVIKECGTA